MSQGQDLCRCGCGQPRCYPVGMTLAEAKVVRRVLGRQPWRHVPAAKSLLAKIDAALKVRS